MTKLERWCSGFNEAAPTGSGGCIHYAKGGMYTKEHLHVFAAKGCDDPTLVLCIDAGSMGFHRIGMCPFIVTP